MSAGETAKSPLDKPLHQLTEDDISQLTREDCRRYLKDKGMRRPSWNKSQAIQQVISLKALLETSPDSDAGSDARRRLHIHPTRKGTNIDTEISVTAEEPVICHNEDPDKLNLPFDFTACADVADNVFSPPRNIGLADEPVGQMTIFYCGKVNVYDDVPADKARALIHLASSPLHFPLEPASDGDAPVHPFPCPLQPPSTKVAPESSVTFLPTLQTVKMTDNSRFRKEEINIFREVNPAAEGSTGRKASVQRYLEKRKDRFKSKRKAGTPVCASMDIYLKGQIINQNLNEQPSRSDTCSPPLLRPPDTPNRCS